LLRSDRGSLQVHQFPDQAPDRITLSRASGCHGFSSSQSVLGRTAASGQQTLRLVLRVWVATNRSTKARAVAGAARTPNRNPGAAVPRTAAFQAGEAGSDSQPATGSSRCAAVTRAPVARVSPFLIQVGMSGEGLRQTKGCCRQMWLTPILQLLRPEFTSRPAGSLRWSALITKTAAPKGRLT
jgi:hypothetical protein